jgi:hypothetical protein
MWRLIVNKPLRLLTASLVASFRASVRDPTRTTTPRASAPLSPFTLREFRSWLSRTIAPKHSVEFSLSVGFLRWCGLPICWAKTDLTGPTRTSVENEKSYVRVFLWGLQTNLIKIRIAEWKDEKAWAKLRDLSRFAGVLPNNRNLMWGHHRGMTGCPPQPAFCGSIRSLPTYRPTFLSTSAFSCLRHSPVGHRFPWFLPTGCQSRRPLGWSLVTMACFMIHFRTSRWAMRLPATASR